MAKIYEAEIWERQVIWERVKVSFTAENEEEAMEQLKSEVLAPKDVTYYDCLETIYDDKDSLAYCKEYIDYTLEEIGEE